MPSTGWLHQIMLQTIDFVACTYVWRNVLAWFSMCLLWGYGKGLVCFPNMGVQVKPDWWGHAQKSDWLICLQFIQDCSVLSTVISILEIYCTKFSLALSQFSITFVTRFQKFQLAMQLLRDYHTLCFHVAPQKPMESN